MPDASGKSAAAVPPDDHLLTLLRGGSQAGEGGYNAVDAWWTALRDAAGTDNAADRLVTVHEAFHATLNDCTAFGIGLATTGVAARFRGNDSTLNRLVAMCRTVHEAYATFTSIWVVSAGDLSLLGGRTDYLAWYQDAADLLPLPPGARRAQLILDEAARVCMQSGALPELLASGLGASRLEVKSADRPDVRFGWLHELTDAEFWDMAWGRCAEIAGALPGWDTLLAADTDPAALELTYSPEIAPTCVAVSEVLYAELAALLRRRGATTLGYDDHQALAVNTIADLERLVPEAQGVLRPALHNESPTLESYEIWSRERLIVRDQPRPARLHRIEDRPSVGLLSDFRGKNHIFCIARPAFRLRRQFAFTAQDDGFLADLADQPVLAVVSTGDDLVDLVVLSRPAHLTAITQARPGELSVLVNVTLSNLGNIAWRDKWAPALTQTGVTALVDLVPLRQFETWCAEGSSLRYALGTIRGGTAGASVFVAELDGGGLRLLLPCTHVTADVMNEYLTRHYPAAHRTEAVFDGVQELIEITMSHLMSVEHSFDVTAYYDAPGGIRHAGTRDPARDRPARRRQWFNRRRG